jgi:hypothetical protein
VRRTVSMCVLLAGSIAIGACSGGGTPAPSAASSSVAPASSAPPASASAATSASAAGSTAVDPNTLEGFCADFASRVESTWPNIDQSNAIVIGPLFNQWSTVAALAPIAGDLGTVFQWMTVASISTSASTPPPDVSAAYDRIKVFADSNC